MKVSVITVCFNAEREIQKTMESVLNQTLDEFEYIIQDGKSTDNTNEIIRTVMQKFPWRKVIYESRPDTGIYNAMNIAVRKASGEWCVFINAGDTFYSYTVLKEVFGKTDQYKGFDVIYGGYRRHDSKNGYVYQSEPVAIMPFKMPFIHQSVFIRTDIQKKYGYDEKFKLCADYDMFFRMYVDGLCFFQIKTIISDFSIEGVSGIKNIEAKREVQCIKEKHIDRFPISFWDRLKWKTSIFVMKIKHRIPQHILIILRKIRAVVEINICMKKTH